MEQVSRVTVTVELAGAEDMTLRTSPTASPSNSTPWKTSSQDVALAPAEMTSSHEAVELPAKDMVSVKVLAQAKARVPSVD
jgi:hypothetical protein